jgi:hypothetical protein
MKRTAALIGAVCVFLAANPALFALAASPEAQESGTIKEPANVTITVVMPEAAPEPAPAIVTVYPSDVTETRENGGRQIIKTFELMPGENPEDIPRDSFERDGWEFTLTDIIRKETASAETREHTETVTLNTDTKELERILPLLAPTMEYMAEDGFAGILSLDVSSIGVETAGTKTSSYTMSITREYPRLSSNDTSLVPKTVTDRGKTYTLAGVDWRAGNTETADYERLPEYYTAVATYTAAGTSTKVTGYITTAKYNGTLAKLSQGRTVYTAHFEGKEIVTPLEFADPSAKPDSGPAETPAMSAPGADAAAEPVPAAEEEGSPAMAERETPEANGKSGAWAAAIPIAAAIAGGAWYFIKKRGKKDNAKTDDASSVAADPDGCGNSGICR